MHYSRSESCSASASVRRGALGWPTGICGADVSPIYDYKCPKCNAQFTDIRLVAERHYTPACYRCGAKTKLLVSAVAGVVKNPAVPRRSK